MGYSPWGHKRVRHDLAIKQQPSSSHLNSSEKAKHKHEGACYNNSLAMVCTTCNARQEKDCAGDEGGWK